MTGGLVAGRGVGRLTATVAIVASGLGSTVDGQDVADRLRLIGYTDRWSVQPGETVRFMVRSEPARFRADIVRLIHGDANPAGPGFKEELIASPVSGEYQGKPQPFTGGSYVTVPDHPALRLTRSFTLQAWIAPSTPGKGAQSIMAKWSESDRSGFGLYLDDGGDLALWLGGPGGRIEKARTGVPLKPTLAASTYRSLGYDLSRNANTYDWYFVAATYDAASGRVALYQDPMRDWPPSPSRAVVERTTTLRSLAENRGPLLIAASWIWPDGDRGRVGSHFNGKIDAPRVYNRALSSEEIAALKRGTAPPDPVAAWDFAKDISSRRVTDGSPNRVHGRTVNTPTRAVTGHAWNGGVTNFRDAPAQYAAIHFHDDDLDDLRWDESFSFTVPANLRSGFYAARLRAGNDTDWVPFFVRPRRGTTTAKIAFLAPTYSYLAYGGFRGKLPYLLSHYDVHSDLSGVTYVSRLKPILEMRPNWNRKRHYVADLYMTNFMETKGLAYDVITDEDLHQEGAALLAPYRVVVTGSHPEYWTQAMLDGLESYLGRGGRLMYLGGNGFYWVISPDPEQPAVIELRRWGGTQIWTAAPGEYHHSTTGELGGLWRFRGRPPQRLTGIGFAAQGWDNGRPYRRQPESFDARAAFIFEGIGADELIGDFPSMVQPHGAAGDEVDRLDFALGTPPHTLLLATASGFSDAYQHVIEENNVADSQQGGTVSPFVRGDMVYFETPNGGGVFSVGSIAWFGSLGHNRFENTVARITENVLRRFASDAPLPPPAR
jgi:N,N-dimethylformamidase